MMDDTKLSATIRAVRKRAQLSQEDLAARLGVRQSSVSQWERGSTAPSTKHLLSIGSVLGGDFWRAIADLTRRRSVVTGDSPSAPLAGKNTQPPDT
jgi:transcriptional regulator with XRE-family HTH domain